MATTGSIISRAQLDIGDAVLPFRAETYGDGITQQIELSRSKVDASTLAVTMSGVPQVQGVDFIVDQISGQLTFTNVPPVDAYIVAVGTSYTYFPVTTWNQFVTTAMAQHNYNRVDSMGYAITLTSLPPVEEYLVALLAMIQALWVMATSAAFDIDISTPEGVHIPRSERYQQLTQIINTRQAQYTQLAEQLNVGLSRIEATDLRRVSRTTNKFVPLYIPQEYNDNRPPTQIFPPIDAYGSTINTNLPEPTRLDLVGMTNNVFSATITGLGSLVGLTLRAHVRPYPGNISSLANFVVTVLDINAGTVTITLTGQQMFYLPISAFWDLEGVDIASNVTTLVFGTFTTQRQGQP